MATQKIIAGMPAYNEEKYIGSMVLKARQYVDQVIVVDDGSSDGTSEVARLAGAEIIKHERNQGYGMAIQSLLEEARKREADVLVLIDADGQHNPAEIPNMLKPLADGFDFIVGTRKEQTGNIPFYRRIGLGVLLRFINVLLKKPVTDSECGFRAFSRKALNTLRLTERGMAISAETVAEVARRELKVAEVPVSVYYHKDGSTLNPWAHGLSVITRILVMISERKPLFFFGISGIILTLFGLAAGIVTFQLYATSGVVSIAWALVAIFLVIIGTLSVFTGLTLRAISSIIHSAITREKN